MTTLKERIGARTGPGRPGSRGAQIAGLQASVEAIRDRMDKQRGRIDRTLKLIGDLSKQSARHKERLDRFKTRLDEVEGAVGTLGREDNLRTLDHGRMTHQVGALEERLGRVEERLASVPASGAADLAGDETRGPSGEGAALAEARALVEAIRVEHEQIRVRMQIVSSYEERLRRVENALLGLVEGDLRDPV